MRRMGRICTGLFALCLMCSLWVGQVLAAEPYTYQITFYTGNHGTFTGTGHVSVDNKGTGSDYEIHMQGSSIVVSGLKAGDRVNFDAAMDGAVSLGGNSKYYVKGIRLSGRDNDTVGMSSFEVKGDQEYVVAYGIRGDMTSYVVNYQDTQGNTLAPGRTYYGNVGDRPVIAFLYMEGYEPQAYNLTKTLSANAAENVFTFTYARITSGGGTGGGGDTGEGGGEAATEGEASAPGPQSEGATVPGGAAAADGAAGTALTGTGEAADTEAGVQAPDAEVPQTEGPQELQELDDEEVPLAGMGENGTPRGAAGVYSAAAVGGVGAIALIAMLILWMKRRKKDGKETETD